MGRPSNYFEAWGFAELHPQYWTDVVSDQFMKLDLWTDQTNCCKPHLISKIERRSIAMLQILYTMYALYGKHVYNVCIVWKEKKDESLR